LKILEIAGCGKKRQVARLRTLQRGDPRYHDVLGADEPTPGQRRDLAR
jgi:hypothetical protein